MANHIKQLTLECRPLPGKYSITKNRLSIPFTDKLTLSALKFRVEVQSGHMLEARFNALAAFLLEDVSVVSDVLAV